MNPNPFFDLWPEDIHSSADQQKRIHSAKSAKTTPDSVDFNEQSGLFPGSGKDPYYCTLSACSCVDYSRRHLPCKHIYRLAIELGLLNESAESGENKNALNAIQIPWKEAVAEIENLTENSQRTIQYFLYLELTHETEFAATLDMFGEELLLCSLVDSIDSPLTAIQAYRRKDIVSVLDENGITGFKRNLSIKNLAAWCLNNVPDVMKLFPNVRVFRFSDRFQSGHKKVYSYLLRKYSWDTYLDEVLKENRIPHGAIFSSADPSVCYFPDDDITELLTFFGCNRCLNGYRTDIEQEK